MLEGCAKHEMFEQETKQSWDTYEFNGLEANELGEQVTDGFEIYLESE